jgi:hypothetical protein
VHSNHPYFHVKLISSIVLLAADEGSHFYCECSCQVAVHEECYGVKASESVGSWVCRACETPDIERECCLCPVKGQFFQTTIFTISMQGRSDS